MRIEHLAPAHLRQNFGCGEPALDRYFGARAAREAARRLTAIFVLVGPSGEVTGYYSLSGVTLLLPDLLGSERGGASRYPPLPAAKLSRLAVDARHQGQGWGGKMLEDALARVAASATKSMAVVAETASERGQAFYLAKRFKAFPDRPERLYRFVSTLKKAAAF